ncbi:MAG TPA: SprB repeat-containing protein [Cyclobacteriaceae bacterium]|nr:SprB repeat-containing protein [Cyclobacteriaceae bacterium]
MKRLLIFFVVLSACSDGVEEEVDCSTLRIELKSKFDPTTCLPADGQISVSAFGGTKPYLFSLNNKTPQPDSTFIGLQGGRFVVEVIDVAQCTKSVEIDLTNFNSGLAASATTSADTDCLEGNGSLQVLPTGGTAPYLFRYKNVINSSSEIAGLKHGIHEVTVVDAEGCEFVLGVNVPRGSTSVSWVTNIKPIIDTRCAKPTCHVAGTGRADLSKFENVKSLASEIRTLTQSKSMPFDEPMPADQIQLIACWVDDGALNN